MKPQLTDEKIVKAEDTLRSWARGMITGKYTRDWRFRDGTKTLIIGYRNLRQFLMLINDLIYYKSKYEELQQAFGQIKVMIEDPIPGTMVRIHKIACQVLEERTKP